MRLIDADVLIEVIEGIDWYHYNDVLKEMIHGANSDVHTPWYKAPDIYDAIEQAPTIDAVEVVRCAECKWYHTQEGCFFSTSEVEADDYCSYGERSE